MRFKIICILLSASMSKQKCTDPESHKKADLEGNGFDVAVEK